jgi:hypothetical protein
MYEKHYKIVRGKRTLEGDGVAAADINASICGSICCVLVDKRILCD